MEERNKYCVDELWMDTQKTVAETRQAVRNIQENRRET
jgi:hypothetical protein